MFPSIGKGGVIIGGAQGEGTVFQGGQAIGEVKMNQLTVGLQFGGQTYSQIIFFEDARALREFTSGNFKFGAQATAVALNTGASAEASTGGGARTSINAGNDNGVEVDSSRLCQRNGCFYYCAGRIYARGLSRRSALPLQPVLDSF